MTKAFADHFAAVAAQYADSRPAYPATLFEWLAGLAPGRSLAWDAGTGSGQAARGLAAYFDHVVATDASEAQIAAAALDARMEYRVALAHESLLADASVDLVTVAQALHWFDLEPFYTEVRRVSRPGGVLAVWWYAHLSIGEEEIDSVLGSYHRETVGPYWPPERAQVEDGYRDIPFPFPRILAPRFTMTASWTLPELLGYVRTWSATARYTERRGADPTIELGTRLAPLWGPAEQRRTATWPLSLRVGRVRGNSG